ncbi:MAG: cellulase family glycosylhydrolase [Bacteroidales bacterium]|nr:cellulase family glycosylhydrolase [Candidatus Scybalocola fimicaballi]
MKHFTNALKKAFCLAASFCLANSAFAANLSGKSASELAKMIRVGWNLGNSLDATGQGANAETSWGNPRTTKEMFDKVKEAGFNAVRIPVSWSTHVSNNGQYQFAIDGQWMARVKEVVNYAYDNGMFVIINIHHDNDQWHMFPSNQYLNQSKKYVTDIWTQVAKEFADYDQHLIFETINEPRVVGDANEWWFVPDSPTPSVAEAIQCINQINQAAVDAIRNVGGNNMDRLVGCPGYVGSIDGVTTSNFKAPNDKAQNRLWISVHAYTPYDFCMNPDKQSHAWNQQFYYDIQWLYNSIRDKVMSKGYPVYIGETSSSNYFNTEDRKQWEKCFFGFSKDYGVPCFLWDNNTVDNTDGAERHGYLNRRTLQWFEPSLITTIMETLGWNPTSVNDEIANEWSVYADGNSIHINSTAEIKNVDVVSINGTKVAGLASCGNECSINVNHNGVYIVVINTESGTSIKKTIVK